MQSCVTYHFLQLEDRAKRHRPWPHTDWLSSHPSKGIRGTDGAVLYPEENKDNTSLRGRLVPTQYSWFHTSNHNNTEREQKCFSILGLMFPSAPVPRCSPPLSLLSYVSDYMVKEQHCRMQRRGIRSESQESRSPDSACSLGYDSRRSSPDRVLDGEVLL